MHKLLLKIEAVIVVKKAIESDCRTEEGVTVGLIDGIISVSRVLKKRDFSSYFVKEVLETF